MRKRLTWLLAAAAAAVLLAAGVLAFWPDPDPIQECFDRVELGRPVEEAEAILERGGLLRGAGIGCVTLWHDQKGETVISLYYRRAPDRDELVVAEKNLRRTDETPLSRLWRRLP